MGGSLCDHGVDVGESCVAQVLEGVAAEDPVVGVLEGVVTVGTALNNGESRRGKVRLGPNFEAVATDE